MHRRVVAPRPDWQARVERVGLLYHTNALPYWNESAYYEFSPAEIEELWSATNTLYALCLEAAQFVIDNRRFGDLAIPDAAVPLILKSWREEPPSLYGRFDLCYDGLTSPKLLEFNADTPTSLLEAGVVQWFWQQDVGIGSDQFNSIHERLVLAWRGAKTGFHEGRCYFASIDDLEDTATIAYLRDTAEEAGILTSGILLSDIGWDASRRAFVDLDGHAIEQLFKLYPWEWLVHEPFAEHLTASADNTNWIEPAWKMLLSNKGILPILWELFPHHPNLLECYAEPDRLEAFAKKPLLSREGANVTLRSPAGVLATEGEYGEEGYVYQALAVLPSFQGNHAVIGSWIIGEESAGIGVRESDGPVTSNLSRFVPHVIT